MELLKRLKTKSVLATLPLAALMVVIGVLTFSISEFWLYFMKPVNLWEVPREELEGKFVTVDLDLIYGSYAYSERYYNNVATGQITEMEYVIDANEEDYCGLVLGEELIGQGDKLMEDSFAYYENEIDEITSGFTVSGVMKEMPDDSLEFYYEFFEIDAETAQEEGIYLPLYLDARRNTASTILGVVFGLFFLALGLIPLIRAMTGRNQKQIREKASQLYPTDPEYILTQANELCQNQKDHKSLKMDTRLILANNTHLYAASELVWAYHSITRHRVYGFIPAGKTHSLMLCMIDGKKLSIPMNKEAQVKEWLQSIQSLAPNALVGYSEEINRAYAASPAQLAQQVAAVRNPQPPVQTEE